LNPSPSPTNAPRDGIILAFVEYDFQIARIAPARSSACRPKLAAARIDDEVDLGAGGGAVKVGLGAVRHERMRGLDDGSFPTRAGDRVAKQVVERLMAERRTCRAADRGTISRNPCNFIKN